MSEFPPAAALPSLVVPDGAKPDEKAVPVIVDIWLASLQHRLEKKNLSDISDLFVEESWWRDVLALSWDFHSKSGLEAIAKFLKESDTELGHLKAIKTGGLAPKLEEEGGMQWIQAGFTFETKYGSGKGLVRLSNIAPSIWRAWTVMTQLEELKSQEKPVQPQTNGVTNGDATATPEKDNLQVLIVGAGVYLRKKLELVPLSFSFPRSTFSACFLFMSFISPPC